MAGGWRRLHNEELYNLFASPNVIRTISLRSMIRVGHVVRMREMQTIFSLDNLKERDRPEDLSINGKIILVCKSKSKVSCPCASVV